MRVGIAADPVNPIPGLMLCLVVEEDIDRVYHGTAPMRFVRGDWLPGPLEDYWKLYGVGVADLILGVAGLVDRMGADSFGNTLKNIGMQAQIVAVPVDYGKVNSPIWYAKNLMRMVPFILSIIDTALIAGGGAISVARTAGGGPLLCRIVGTITGGATSAVGEGVIEAGHAYHEAEARGYTQEEMNAVFDKVLLGNIGLLSVTNTAQFGAAFMLPGGATARFLTKALIFGFEAASEGVEEGAQLFITRGALGDKVAVFDDEFWQNFNLGLVGGLTFGGAGSVYSAIQNRIETKMTDKQKMKIEEDITEGMMQGISEQEAQGKALDKFAETPEGEAIITETVQEIMEEEQAKAKEIGEVQKVVDAIKPVSDQVQPISERAQGLVDETLAETALNQIQSTNPNLTVPVGGEVGLGVKDANVVLPQTGVTEAELTIPGSQEIIDGLLIPNWIRTKLKGAARVPVFRKIHEAVLGWRSLIDKQSQATEDIVGRAAVVYGAIMRTGTNISRIELNTLKDIVPNPVRYFGFNDVGYSGKMAARLLPAYKSERAISGTLEHVFTHPEMYNWAKMDKGLRYVARVNQIYDAIRKLLQKEGVVLDAVNERWIHRVVTGRMIEGKVVEVRGRPGRAGVQPGAVPAYKKPRAFETMAEGIQALIRYEPNIEVPVSSYIEEAYKEIAGERFTKLIEEFGVTPSERLLERFPEIAERAELTKEELADAAKLHSVISRAKRGEKLPEQTLRAMERRFPGLGRRLRALIGEKSSEVQGLRNALAQMQDFVKSLQAKTEEAIKAAKEQPTIEIPTDQKIRQAFKVMEYEDRLAFRNTMDTQLEEIGGMVANQEGEIEALDETLKTDPVATFIVHVGKIKRHLDYFLKHGEWPESFTLKEAAALTMKPVEQVQARTKEGRVPSAYVIDELADHFNLTEGELITRIEGVADSRERLADLRVLVDAANQREEGINRMLNILAEVEGKPENVSPEEPRIPTAEAGMPEAGLQTDIFGYQTPVQPRGKGEIRQMGIDDYQKLAKMREEAGMPPPNVNIKPKVEGISELAGDTEIQQATFPVPDEKTVQERKEAFNELASEAKALVEARKAPYWRARAERAAKMEIVSRGLEKVISLCLLLGVRCIIKTSLMPVISSLA